MEQAKPLPDYLVRRYHGWKASTFDDNKGWYQRLATEGQRPRVMVISCCDSRVQPTAIFEADDGEFFVHRNVAALVPPYAPDEDYHGTSAAVEYAVTALKVSNLLVLGHSGCGGVAACHEKHAGNAPELEEPTSFIGNWIDILTPGLEMIKDAAPEDRLEQLEKAAVLVSINNLAGFPFIAEARKAGTLSLHGLWTNIAQGVIEGWDPARGKFVPI